MMLACEKKILPEKIQPYHEALYINDVFLNEEKYYKFRTTTKKEKILTSYVKNDMNFRMLQSQVRQL